jgi:hypothetical protein
VVEIQPQATSPRFARTVRKIPLPEWRALLSYHPNLLLEGAMFDVEETLVALATDFYPRRISWSEHGHCELPVSELGEITIVVREVTARDARSLDGLQTWLEAARRPIQVVTTSSVPLFPLVERRAFPVDLYYRLNTLRFQL